MKCLICDRTLRELMSWSYILHRSRQPLCEKCASQFQSFKQSFSLSGLDFVTIHYEYNEMMQDVIYSYKGFGHIRLAKLFRPLFTPLKKERRASIVPIPSHVHKVERIGFQPIEHLLRVAEVPYDPLLVKVYDGELSRLSKEERQQVDRIVRVREGVRVRAHCILIDDVITTGTTLQQAAAVLREAGAKRIDAFVLSRPVKRSCYTVDKNIDKSRQTY
ncbi:ComF family protein [Savagea faecisuis]|uniref:ComF family protein n=1 Tax=Savagea faecisuis TaxID=1274803 RepID=A0ABW3H1A7_9BACL